MRCLLDTHTIIWYFENNGRLSQNAETIIDDPDNLIYISSVSIWEIAIKTSLKKLDVSLESFLREVDQAEFTIVQLENSYMLNLLNLPKIHKDPFDRLLIATAQTENMTLITEDDNIHQYDVQWVW